jgi:cytochrome c biogenesis protein CcmG/thiol:disulfide interchange protein DsbE
VKPPRRGIGAAGWLAALLLAPGVWACGAGEERDPGGAAASQAPAEPAPDFTLPDLEGRPVSLAQQRGKVVIVDFWATWCPPCEFQVPELNKLWQAHRERGDLAVIGVSVDVDGAEVVRPWVQEKAVEYTIVLGDEDLARRFGAMGFPTMAVVGPGGELHSLHVGLVEYDTLEALVAEAAAGS